MNLFKKILKNGAENGQNSKKNSNVGLGLYSYKRLQGLLISSLQKEATRIEFGKSANFAQLAFTCLYQVPLL